MIFAFNRDYTGHEVQYVVMNLVGISNGVTVLATSTQLVNPPWKAPKVPPPCQGSDIIRKHGLAPSVADYLLTHL